MKRNKNTRTMYLKKATAAVPLLALLFQAYTCNRKPKRSQALFSEVVAEEGQPMQGKTNKSKEAAADVAASRSKRGKSRLQSKKRREAVPLPDNGIAYADAIAYLREKADQKRGIRWSCRNDDLVRDATDSNGVLYASEDYAVQVMSMYRAADRLCALHGRSGQKFNRWAKEFMDLFKNEPTYGLKPEDFWLREVKRIKTSTLKELQTFFPEYKGLSEKIRTVESYASMEDPHYNITTRFKIKDKLFELHDQKWLKLTEKQRAEFETRESQPWYRSLPELEQKLVDRYLEKFLDGAHYFPTQIRNLPGCRNAYKKTVVACNGTNQRDVVACYVHLGTLASLVENGATSEHISSENWKQIQAHMSAGSDLKVVCLNHRLDCKALDYVGEKQIVDQTKRIVGEDAFTCWPFGIAGSFSTPVFKGPVQALLARAEAMDEKQYPQINNRLFVQYLDSLRRAANRSTLKNKLEHNFRVRDNYYAKLAATYSACKSYLDRVQGKLGDPSVAICCKSGKDRTGDCCRRTDFRLINLYLEGQVDGGLIRKNLAATGHVQIEAGCNAGLPGRVGLKGMGIRGSSSDDESEALFPPHAKLN